jgi:hypothetical protein
MKEQFQKIPSALQKQILVRLAGSGLGVVMIALVMTYRGNIQFLIPGIAITITFVASAWALFSRCSQEKYVVLRGVCEEIEHSGLRKRLKSIHIQCGDKSVKIMGQLHKLKNLKIGDVLEAYIADTAPVYEHEGCYVITNILAIRKER